MHRKKKKTKEYAPKAGPVFDLEDLPVFWSAEEEALVAFPNADQDFQREVAELLR